jgi:hypothetical protein
MRYLFALGLTLGLPGLVVAGDFEATLRHYLAKSDVIVAGEFTSEPAGNQVNGGFHHYQGDFKITRIVKWDSPDETRVGDTIKVHILLDGDERLPELTKGGKCLLFLTCRHLKPNPSFISADPWIGVQRPNAGLEKTLSRLVVEQKNTPLVVPAEKDIDLFYPDPVRRDVHFKDFKVEKADLVKILRDYHVVHKQHWLHRYAHVGGEDRTGKIVLRDGTPIQYMVRPGGLTTLTFRDGRTLYLAREK